MRQIPPKLRKQIEADEWMKKCCYCSSHLVEWEHCWIYAGKQINEWWAIVPLCMEHHRGNQANARVKRFGKWQSLMRGIKEAERDYPKFNWARIKKSLDKEFLCLS